MMYPLLIQNEWINDYNVGGHMCLRMWMCTHMRASVGSSCAKNYEGDWELQTMLGQ